MICRSRQGFNLVLSLDKDTSDVSGEKNDGELKGKVSLEKGKKKISVEGNGNGPIDAFVNAVNKDLAMKIKVSDYHQHAISSGSDAKAVAYIEIQSKGNSFWGVGIHENTVIAGLKAVISGLNRIYSR